MKIFTIKVTPNKVTINNTTELRSQTYNKSSLWVDVKPLDAFVLGYAFNKKGDLASCTIQMHNDLTHKATKFD